MTIKTPSFIPLVICVASLCAAVVIQKATALPTVNDLNYQTVGLGAADGSCVIATGSATNLNLPIDMSKQRDLAVFFQFVGNSTDASNTETVVMSPSLDGSVAGMDTTKTIVFLGTANSTTKVTVSTNLASGAYSGYSGIAGYRYLILRYITNATALSTTNWIIVPMKHGVVGSV